MNVALTAKQACFVKEYLIDLNATQAAKRAGYSERRAGEIGWQLLQKTTIQNAIKKEQQERSARTEVTADWVIDRLREESQRTGEGASHGARVKALELLGKHQSLFTDKVELSGSISVTSILDELSARRARHGKSG